MSLFLDLKHNVFVSHAWLSVNVTVFLSSDSNGIAQLKSVTYIIKFDIIIHSSRPKSPRKNPAMLESGSFSFLLLAGVGT